MAQQGVEQAVRAIKHERVRKTINTGNPLITQKNAPAYFKRVEVEAGGVSQRRTNVTVIGSSTASRTGCTSGGPGAV
jgi:hypothetical protein